MKTEYIPVGLTLTDEQKKSIAYAIGRSAGVTIKLPLEQLDGPDSLALTKRQVKHIESNKGLGHGVQLKLSKTQLLHMKHGGFLPFLPLILAGISAAGALSGGISGVVKAVHDKNASDAALAEQSRHNKEVEAQLSGSGLQCCPTCSGSGLYLGKNR